MDLPESIAGFDKMLGVEFVEASGDRVVLACEVRPDLHQPYGIVHGGVHCTLVESAASIGAALWFGERGNVVGVLVSGGGENINFAIPIGLACAKLRRC